jgi:hypothetical protein
MKRLSLGVAILVFAGTALAQRVSDLNGNHVQLHPTNENAQNDNEPGWAKPGGGNAQNLIDHGGAVIANAKVVSIFWGPTWSNSQNSDNGVAADLTNFFGQFGTSPEYNTITEYRVNQHDLGRTAWYDSSTPPTNVTDSILQGEVVKYLSTHTYDGSTVYEVFLPGTSYSSYGSSTSCGGPNLQYCAYHGNFNYNGTDIKYASIPYASCSGCKASGFTLAQNLEHFACHETREAATDADGTAWYDRRGYEADDKCAWSPAPFIGTGGFGYQWEWSNLARGCVKTR